MIHSSANNFIPESSAGPTPDMVVQKEIISHFIEQEYLDPMDDAVIDYLVEEFRRRGLDPEALGLSR